MFMNLYKWSSLDLDGVREYPKHSSEVHFDESISLHAYDVSVPWKNLVVSLIYQVTLDLLAVYTLGKPTVH